jgi:hypothetical protein
MPENSAVARAALTMACTGVMPIDKRVCHAAPSPNPLPPAPLW